MTRKLSTLSLLTTAVVMFALSTVRAQMTGGNFSLKADLESGSVNLNWTQPTSFSVNYYLVYKSEFNPRLMTPIMGYPSTVIDSTTGTAYVDTAAPAPYMASMYLVRAFSSSGDSVSSNVAVVYGGSANGGRDHVTILSTPQRYATVDSLYQYQVKAESSDTGAVLTYSLGEHPMTMAIDPHTGLVDWIPQARGYYGVEIDVTSSLGGHAEQEYAIMVAKYDATISGTITDTTGMIPLAHVIVRLYQFPEMMDDMPDLKDGSPFTYSAVTDSMGHYSISHVDAGAYYVHATPTNSEYIAEWYDDVQSVREATRIDVSSDSTYTADFKLANRFALLPNYAISGTVTDSASGTPIKDATVLFARVGFVLNEALDGDPHEMAAQGVDASFDYRDYFQNIAVQANVQHDFGILHPGPFVFMTRTDSNGVYQDTLPEGHYILVAQAKGYFRTFYDNKHNVLTSDVLDLISDTTGIDFALLKIPPVVLGSISGMVTDTSTGSGLPARLIAFRDIWNHPDTLKMHVAGTYFAESDSTGAFTFDSLAPGDYKVLAIPLGNYAPSFYSTMGPTVRWKDATDIPVDGNSVSGINIGVVALPDSTAGYTSITGVVTSSGPGNAGVGGALVYATDANMNVLGYGISDASGTYVIAGLAPGTYNVFADVVGYSSSGSTTSSPTYSSTGAPTYFSTNLSVTPETPTAITAKPVQPTGFALDQNYPNPFNPTTQIAFSIPAQMHVSVTIFNILGEKVATLVNANLSAGEHLLTWNALNQNGEMMPTGVYFYRLSTPTFTAVKKMLLLK